MKKKIFTILSLVLLLSCANSGDSSESPVINIREEVIALNNADRVPAESSKDLLAKALRLSNSINNNLTVERRLSIYEEIQNVVDKIILEYSGTDEGIKLLSGQTVGSFNYSSIQSNYVEELTSYYDTVCKVSPSFDCIAFVSLDQGVKSCRNSNNFDSLDSAHKEIINALNIFTSQNSKEQYRSLALNSYRNCLSSSKFKPSILEDVWPEGYKGGYDYVGNIRINRTSDIGKTQEEIEAAIINDGSEVLQDYFSANLVPIFISLGMQEQARAMTQQIKDDYSKFRAVLELYKAENDLSRDYTKRMVRFIRENLAYQESALASLKLKTEYLAQSNFHNTYEERYEWNDIKFPSFSSRLDWIERGWDKCSVTGNKNYFNMLVDYFDIFLIRFYEIESMHSPEYLKFNGEDSTYRLKESPGFGDGGEQAYLNECAKMTDKRDYGLALDIYKKISAFNYEDGKEFLNHAHKINFSTNEMMEYYFLYEQRKPVIVLFVHELERALNRDGPSSLYISLIYDDYYQFKKHVTNNQICEATDMLFKDFEGSDNYNRAIAYLNQSPNFDATKNYDCGNAELELLLN